VVSCSTLFLAVAFRAVSILYSEPKPVDFLSSWAAARLALSGQAATAYDLNAHHAAEQLAVAFHSLLPFAYPPPFLLAVTPFGLAPFWLAFALWLAVTTTIYAVVAGRKGALPFAMAQPSVLANFLIGQSGFLTTTMFAGGLAVLRRKPWLGGGILGLLVIKPQLALALPFAMIAGREWKAIGGGALSSVSALLIAFVIFGSSTYQGFFSALPVLTNGMERGSWPWTELASVFALLRFLGVPQAAALSAHAMVAFVAIALVCRAWWLRLDEREAILAAATILVPPYIFTYDALLLVIPMLWLLKHPRPSWMVPLSWLLCFLPVAYYFDFYAGPNTIPFAAALLLWALHARPKAELSPQLSGIAA
jgi:hypothetical protein